MEEEYGEWEEETLVVAELSGLIDSETLKKDNLKCEVLGIDTDRPVLQIENYVFSGEYEDSVGTAMIFQGISADSSVPDSDLKDLEYMCSTRKKLGMKRAFLQSKNIAETHTQNIQDEDEHDTDGAEEDAEDMEPDTDPAESTDTPVASTSGVQITQTSTGS
ncbi:general transcription factor 3C polypeptide 6-like [Haliotis rufescens]|uniref:general transcription factor 3C polypeptide 6-like n=1 Tax=Haliotis rufescens TaxID=6454 RepID=UPI00201EF52D|nr:general transcription factor 3C polypeptide 6-like [Haliotis rufescens]